MYEKFLKQITDFIFIDQEPQKADIIFIPGNGFPNPSERAAELRVCEEASAIRSL